MRLLEPGYSAAVLLGAQIWPENPTLNGGPAFADSAAGMESYICSDIGLRLDPDRDVLNLFDADVEASEQLNAIGKFLREWVERSGGGQTALTDLLIYYVGHGGFFENTNEFYMLLRRSRPANPLSCLPPRALASCLRNEAPFVRQVVILDCCFSGATHRMWQSSSASRVAAAAVQEAMPRNGTVLLCSSAENEPSMAPSGSKRTMFTGALLEALQLGSPRIRGDLSAREARDLAFSRMEVTWGAAAVRPVVYGLDPRGVGDISEIGLFPNPAVSMDTDDPVKIDRVNTGLTATPSLLKNFHKRLAHLQHKPLILFVTIGVSLAGALTAWYPSTCATRTYYGDITKFPLSPPTNETRCLLSRLMENWSK
jgi:hypothetical protein